MPVQVRCSACRRVLIVVWSLGDIDLEGDVSGQYELGISIDRIPHAHSSVARPILRRPDHGWRGPVDLIDMNALIGRGAAPRDRPADQYVEA